VEGLNDTREWDFQHNLLTHSEYDLFDGHASGAIDTVLKKQEALGAIDAFSLNRSKGHDVRTPPSLKSKKFDRLTPGKTICLVSQEFGEGSGGIGAYITALARILSKQGNIVFAVTKADGEISTVDFQDGCWVHRVAPVSDCSSGNMKYIHGGFGRLAAPSDPCQLRSALEGVVGELRRGDRHLSLDIGLVDRDSLGDDISAHLHPYQLETVKGLASERLKKPCPA
jgi:hypothetical protein